MMPKYIAVTLFSADGLPKTDIFSKSDPYVEIHLGTLVKRTPVIKNGGSNPVWNTTLYFPYQEENEMEIKVYDQDMLTSDDLMGSAKLSLDFLKEAGTFQGTIPLFRAAYKMAGALSLRVKPDDQAEI